MATETRSVVEAVDHSINFTMIVGWTSLQDITSHAHALSNKTIRIDTTADHASTRVVAFTHTHIHTHTHTHTHTHRNLVSSCTGHKNLKCLYRFDTVYTVHHLTICI